MNVETASPKLEALLTYLKQFRGFDFTVYKRPTLGRRIQRRMQTVGVEDFESYIDYLEVHPEEFAALFDTILINVTGFYRDPEAWQFLQTEVLPSLLSSKPPSEPIRLWTAGCATGEEAYTLAMVMAEVISVQEVRQRVKIYCTDIDDSALFKARLGTYTPKETEDVPAKIVEKYFTGVNTDGLAFDKDLRRTVIFGRHDLATDAPISRIDLLSCRNTLMYFNLETQSKILNKFHFALTRYGVLFLGKAEMLLTHGSIYVPINLKHRLFAKVPSPEQRNHFPIRDAESSSDGAALEDVPLRDAAFKVGHLPQIVLDNQGVLHRFNEQARTYFRLTPKDVGRPLRDLDVASRLHDLSGWIERALNERRALVMKRVPWTPGSGNAGFLDIHIVPLQMGTQGPLGASVTFADVTSHIELEQELQAVKTQLGAANEELHTTNEELQSTVEELETTNEELQSTNEELETTNEELQSSNEEMETMNEELQSTNEELQAINEELRQRGEGVKDVNTFLSSILGGMRPAVAVLDADFQVRIWNAKAQDMWGFRTDEVLGKHFLNLGLSFSPDRLRQPLRSIISGEVPSRELTIEAVNRRGKNIVCRITLTPLIDAERNVTGVIIMMEEAA